MKILYEGVAASVLGSLLALTIVGAPSAAEASPSIDDGSAVLSKVAPFALWGDQAATEVSVSDTGDSARSLKTQATNEGAPSVQITTTPSSDSTPASIGFTLDGTDSQVSTQNGVRTFTADDPSSARYVSETPSGASIITAYQSPQDSYVSKTTFDFTPGERPVPKPGGGYYLRDGGDVKGAIEAPWAVDANGTQLETTYKWDGPTLTQTVEVPTNAAFPVVADPAWTYTWTAVVKIGSPADIHKRMHNCFNCIFPVNGAPKAFPIQHQKLPLKVGIGSVNANFTCTFGQETYMKANPLYPNGDFGFYFDAAKGHVDGVGSMISFDWWTEDTSPISGGDPAPGEKMRFTVGASVVNANPLGVPRAVYRAGAKSEWGKFVQKYVWAAGGADGLWYWTN